MGEKMREFEFYIVDVFAETKFSGNQLAVVKSAHSLSTKEMQKIAKEMNFSETTFILSEKKREDGYDVRIFTPKAELPFAGHPSLGTAYIIQKESTNTQVEQVNLNLKVGQIPVTIKRDENNQEISWMKLKNPDFGDVHESRQFAQILGLNHDDFEEHFPIREVSYGTFCFIVPLKTLDAVKRAQVNLGQFYEYITQTQAKTILVFTKDTLHDGNDLHVRFFGHYLGVPEDPATGSANGCLAAYLVKYKYIGSNTIDIRIEQGYELDRPSLLLLKATEESGKINVNIGGKVFMIAKGKIFM
ncbi:MAG: PhzF family phenazine biosynthesis protein [Candidatus Aminicenantes bacterium]|jgi:trans-2,3-dihydro-3-hydroxyanthranilate isomerase